MKCNIKCSPLIKNIDYDTFLIQPIVIRVNKINEEFARKFDKQISDAHETGQPIIPIVIDSYGGDVYALMSMVSSLRHAQLPIATIVEGKAMSAGTILFSCGSEGYRFMDKDASIMIHHSWGEQFGNTKELKSAAQETERINNRIFKIMANNCGKDDQYFLKLLHEKANAEWYMDAEEAKYHNLANHLRVPSLSININVDFKFE